MSKKCDRCSASIPDEFQNALCLDCYNIVAQENEAKKKMVAEELKSANIPLPEELHQKEAQPHSPISDPNYKPNPLAEDIDMVERNYIQYQKTGKWLWGPTKGMYEFIRNSFIDIVKSHPQYPKFIWKPLVCDIGMGSGLGSNILSQEADFVWGIDKDEKAVKFATELFARTKNNIYYTPEIRFDVIDIENPPPNVDMQFDTAVAIEILEHLQDPECLLRFIKHILYPHGIAWISTPNRANPHIGQEHPKNKFHTMELTSQEFMAVLKKYFKDVQFYNSIGEPCGEDTTHTPLLALCSNLL